MEFPIKFDTLKSGRSIVYIEGYNFQTSIIFLSEKIDFVFANSAGADEMLHFLDITSGSSLFAKLSLLGCLVFKRFSIPLHAIVNFSVECLTSTLIVLNPRFLSLT